jgi:hypothetical protein
MLATAILTEVLEQLNQTCSQVERLQDLLVLMRPKSVGENRRASAALLRRAVTQIRRSRRSINPVVSALYPPTTPFAPVDLSLRADRHASHKLSPPLQWTTIRRAQVPITVERILRTLFLKKTQLARATGVPKTMVRKWETGRAYTNIPWSLQALDELADALESRLSPEEIKTWLKTPNDAFRNEPPKTWLLAGRARIVTWVFVRLPTPTVRKNRLKDPRERVTATPTARRK